MTTSFLESLQLGWSVAERMLKGCCVAAPPAGGGLFKI
jgi:hypothetical protein